MPLKINLIQDSGYNDKFISNTEGCLEKDTPYFMCDNCNAILSIYVFFILTPRYTVFIYLKAFFVNKKTIS